MRNPRSAIRVDLGRWLAGIATTILCLTPIEAHAELVLCNRMNIDVQAIVAIPSNDAFGPADVRGTYSLGPGACMTVAISDVSGGTFYFAEARDGRYWAGDTNDPKNAFCIDLDADKFEHQEWSALQGRSCLPARASSISRGLTPATRARRSN